MSLGQGWCIGSFKFEDSLLKLLAMQKQKTGFRHFYGPGSPYEAFAGRDASRALAKMSFEEKDLGSRELDDLSLAERESLLNWEAQFRSKYDVVGKLVA